MCFWLFFSAETYIFKTNLKQNNSQLSCKDNRLFSVCLMVLSLGVFSALGESLSVEDDE